MLIPVIKICSPALKAQSFNHRLSGLSRVLRNHTSRISPAVACPSTPPAALGDYATRGLAAIPLANVTESVEIRHIPGMRNFTRPAGRSNEMLSPRGFKGTHYGAAAPGRHVPLLLTMRGPGFAAELTIKAGTCVAADEMFDFLIGAKREWIRDYASRNGWSITTAPR